MGNVNHTCGTPSCIAGYGKLLFKDIIAAKRRDSGSSYSYDDIEAVLDLTEEQAEELFMPKTPDADWWAEENDPGYVTAQHAAAVLRHLAKTGDIDWRVTEYTDSVEQLIAYSNCVGRGEGNGMNVDRILQLADVIEKQLNRTFDAPAGFSMETVRHSCGTPSCIIGFTCDYFVEEVTLKTPSLRSTVARKVLGLSYRQADVLFYTRERERELDNHNAYG